MITVLRQSFGKKAFRVVAWVTILSVAGIFSLESLFRGKSSSYFATVNGEPITQQEFSSRAHAEAQRIQLIRQQFGDDADFILQLSGHTGNPEEFARDVLIGEKLLNSLASKLGLKISPEYVAKKLQDPAFCMQALGNLVPAYVFDGYGSLNQKALINYLQRQGMTIADFEDEVLTMMKRMLVMSLISTAAYVPTAHAYEIFVRDNAERTFEVLSLSLDTYIKAEQKTVPTDEELKVFFDTQNQLARRYFVPEKRSGTIWKITPEAYSLEKNDLNRFKKLFAADARQLLDSDKEEFARFMKEKKAKEEKVTHSSKRVGAALKALFALSSPGSRDFVVDASGGYIVELTEIAPAHTPEFEKVKKEVLEDYYKDKALAKLAADIEEGVTSLRENPSNIKEFIEKTKAAHEIVGGSTQDLEKKGLPAQRLAHMLHPNEVLGTRTKTGAAIVVLKSIEVKNKETFAVKQPELYASLYQQNAQQLGYAVVADLQKNAKINIITK